MTPCIRIASIFGGAAGLVSLIAVFGCRTPRYHDYALHVRNHTSELLSDVQVVMGERVYTKGLIGAGVGKLEHPVLDPLPKSVTASWTDSAGLKYRSYVTIPRARSLDELLITIGKDSVEAELIRYSYVGGERRKKRLRPATTNTVEGRGGRVLSKER